MRDRRLSRCAVVTILALAAVSPLHAQARRENPSAAEAAAALRTHRRYTEAVWVLTQVHGVQPRDKMDAVADSLVAIAVGFPGRDAEATRIRAAAMTGLMMAAKGNAGGEVGGTPYTGATERFMRIAETAKDNGVRAAALSSLTKLPATPATYAFFRKVATSQDPVARWAVNLLDTEMGAEGQAVAHDLYRSGQVTQPEAKKALAGVAMAHGWR